MHLFFLGVCMKPLVSTIPNPALLLKYQETVTDALLSDFETFAPTEDTSGSLGTGMDDIWDWARGPLLDAMLPSRPPGRLGPNTPIGPMPVTQVRNPREALRNDQVEAWYFLSLIHI